MYCIKKYECINKYAYMLQYAYITYIYVHTYICTVCHFRQTLDNNIIKKIPHRSLYVLHVHICMCIPSYI